MSERRFFHRFCDVNPLIQCARYGSKPVARALCRRPSSSGGRALGQISLPWRPFPPSPSNVTHILVSCSAYITFCFGSLHDYSYSYSSSPSHVGLLRERESLLRFDFCRSTTVPFGCYGPICVHVLGEKHSKSPERLLRLAAQRSGSVVILAL